MAKTAFLVIVLLLALTENYVDCMIAEINCKTAQFGQNANGFDKFVEKCAPAEWYGFFSLNEVKLAVAKISDSLKSPNIQPPMPLTFRALKLVPPDAIRVVIIGQDPTPQPGQATGLAFSVTDPRKVGSVLNVLLEVALEGWSVDITNGDLTKWAEQGVLLLNSALTVLPNQAGSHLGLWRQFTEMLIQYISNHAHPSVWLLWGNEAQSFIMKRKLQLINKNKHYIIKGGHPSPLGGVGTNTFFGGNYFFCSNQFLSNRGRGPVDWGLAVPNDVRLEVNSPLYACPPEPVPTTTTSSKGSSPPPKKKIKTGVYNSSAYGEYAI